MKLLMEFNIAANSVLVSPAFLALKAPLVLTPTLNQIIDISIILTQKI